MHTIAEGDGPFAEPIRLVLTHRFGVGNSHFRTGSNVPRWVDTVFGGCWPREVFRRVGGFNEELVRSQDMEFNVRLRRAGGRILLAPDLESHYWARANLSYFVRHNWANGIWAVLPFAYTQGSPVRLRHLVPLAFVLSLVCSVLALFVSARLRALPLLVLGPYLAANSHGFYPLGATNSETSAISYCCLLHLQAFTGSTERGVFGERCGWFSSS